MICGKHSDIGAGFPPCTLVFPANHYAPYSSIFGCQMVNCISLDLCTFT
jgi:hypothetical protein